MRPQRGLYHYSFMVALCILALAYAGLAPSALKQWCSARLITSLTLVVPKTGSSMHALDGLDTWDRSQTKAWDQAGMWMPSIINHLDANLLGLQVQQMQTLLGSASLAQVILLPMMEESWVVWIRSRHVMEVGSSVTIGDTLVGYIDFVAGPVARVRLIYDSACQVSVRTLRPGSPLQDLRRDIARWVEYSQSLPPSPTLNAIFKQLEIIKKELDPTSSWTCTSKGLLVGKCPSSGLQKMGLLQGIGFNYSWPDEFFKTDKQGLKPSLVREGDLLITSGLDGRFPAGLRVAFVTSIQTNDPAKLVYQLQARPLMGSMQDLQWVWVLPALTSHDLQNVE